MVTTILVMCSIMTVSTLAIALYLWLLGERLDTLQSEIAKTSDMVGRMYWSRKDDKGHTGVFQRTDEMLFEEEQKAKKSND